MCLMYILILFQILSLINGGLTGYNLFHGQSGINSAHHDHSALHNASGRGIEVAALRGKALSCRASLCMCILMTILKIFFPAAENWFMIILVLCVCLFGTSIILILGVIRVIHLFLYAWSCVNFPSVSRMLEVIIAFHSYFSGQSFLFVAMDNCIGPDHCLGYSCPCLPVCHICKLNTNDQL